MGLQYTVLGRRILNRFLEHGTDSGQAALLSGICICGMALAIWTPIWTVTFALTLNNAAVLKSVP